MDCHRDSLLHTEGLRCSLIGCDFSIPIANVDISGILNVQWLIGVLTHHNRDVGVWAPWCHPRIQRPVPSDMHLRCVSQEHGCSWDGSPSSSNDSGGLNPSTSKRNRWILLHLPMNCAALAGHNAKPSSVKHRRHGKATTTSNRRWRQIMENAKSKLRVCSWGNERSKLHWWIRTFPRKPLGRIRPSDWSFGSAGARRSNSGAMSIHRTAWRPDTRTISTSVRWRTFMLSSVSASTRRRSGRTFPIERDWLHACMLLLEGRQGRETGINTRQRNRLRWGDTDEWQSLY